MTDHEIRRRELADFLRTRRARLSPEMCGLPTGPRRRASGLRREEVAQLAGVSSSWYTKLEQGRDINMSVRFMRGLAEALKLNAVEKDQLFELTLLKPASPAMTQGGDLISALQRMIDGMTISPAFILTARADYVGSNEAAKRILGGDYEHSPRLENNLLINLFLNQRARDVLPDWMRAADYHVAVFRSAYGRNAGNPSFVALVERLTRESTEFARIWKKHEMQMQVASDYTYRHHGVGDLRFEFISLYADPGANIRIDIHTPLDELDSKRKLALILGADR